MTSIGVPKALGPTLASRHVTNHVLPHRPFDLPHIELPSIQSHPTSNRFPTVSAKQILHVTNASITNIDPLHTKPSNVNPNNQSKLQCLHDQSTRANHRKPQPPIPNIHLLHSAALFPIVNRRCRGFPEKRRRLFPGAL